MIDRCICGHPARQHFDSCCNAVVDHFIHDGNEVFCECVEFDFDLESPHALARVMFVSFLIGLPLLFSLNMLIFVFYDLPFIAVLLFTVGTSAMCAAINGLLGYAAMRWLR